MKVICGNCELEIVIEDGDVKYIHPLTNQKYESIEGVFQGWSEQDEEANKRWDTIIETLATGQVDEHISQDADYTIEVEKDDRISLYYDKTLVGKILTNHSMSIDDAIASLDVDIDDYDDYELFRLVY
jgi:hypothetical protein